MDIVDVDGTTISSDIVVTCYEQNLIQMIFMAIEERMTIENFNSRCVYETWAGVERSPRLVQNAWL